jgi:hypothetical protein
VSGRLGIEDDYDTLIGREIGLKGVIDDIQQLVTTIETAATFETAAGPI